MTTVAQALYPGGKLDLDESDKLWLARSLGGETDHTEAGRAAAAWVMLSRTVWMLLHGHATTAGLKCSQAPSGRGAPELEPVLGPMTFTAGIRCFSAPVNPFQTQADPARAARRSFWISATPAEVEARSPGTIDFVDRFFAGKVANPYPGAADFDAPREVPRGAHVIATVGGNALMYESGTEHWTADTIRIVPVTCGGTLLAAAGGLALLLAVLYARFR